MERELDDDGNEVSTVVGNLFAGFDTKLMLATVYSCDRYDRDTGYLFRSVSGIPREKRVQGFEIGRVYFRAKDLGDLWQVNHWHGFIKKQG